MLSSSNGRYTARGGGAADTGSQKMYRMKYDVDQVSWNAGIPISQVTINRQRVFTSTSQC